MRRYPYGLGVGLGILGLLVGQDVAAQSGRPVVGVSPVSWTASEPSHIPNHHPRNHHLSHEAHRQAEEPHWDKDHHETHCHFEEEEPAEGHLIFRADYLYLQPRRRAVDFVIVDPNQDGRPQGNIESALWRPNSGFRLGGGYQLPGCEWQIGAYFTYFKNSDTRQFTAPDGGTLYATLTHPGFVDAVDFAKAINALEYYVLDIEVGRTFLDTDHLTLYLGGGGRFAWIDQELNVSYDGTSAFNALVSSPILFDGAGVRVGGEMQWKLCKGFRCYGRAYGSMLTGDFRTRLFESNNAGGAIISNVTDDFRKVVPVMEMGVGLAWHGNHIHFRAGYELTNWFGLVDSPDFVHDYTNKLGARTGDLSFQGLAAQFGINY
ncbi:MAG: Lpg1974 family pore-forming outer membrane protein [Gemmataceae bacterium]